MLCPPRFPLAIGLTTLAGLFLPTRAPAMRQSIPTGERCARATLVVDAEVISQEGIWNGDRIDTLVDLHVHSVLKGHSPETLTLQVPGGEVGGLVLRLSEAPTFATDHRYLLLLEARSDGTWTPVAGPDGVFPLPERSTAAARAIASQLGACHVR